MSFPNEKEIKKALSQLADVEPTVVHDRESFGAGDRLKHDLCEKIVKYLVENRMSQRRLAKKLEVDPARINEIVKYKFHLFSIEKLLSYVEKIDPSIKISIAS